MQKIVSIYHNNSKSSIEKRIGYCLRKDIEIHYSTGFGGRLIMTAVVSYRIFVGNSNIRLVLIAGAINYEKKW